ncbi:DUF2742 domain-containing protein [Mycobacteroides chelonae]|uniref:DUF2742 domain-containing protein n=1 Tax=Mycobacteroides chelonae TaxID=1774 RepID=UPI0009925AC4
MIEKKVKAPVIVPGLSPESREVSWWPTHVFLEALVAQANQLPAAGSSAWCALADGDPVKLLALAVAGEHHVLRCELDQIAQTEASKAIAACVDWSVVARSNRQRADAIAIGTYIPRRAS